MAWVAALASTLAVALSGVIADRLIVAREDDRLQGAVEILARELAGAPSDRASVAAVVDDEDNESARLGMRLTLVVRGTPIGGARNLPIPMFNGCTEVAFDRHPWRLCRFALGGRVAVAASDLAAVRVLQRRLSWAAVGSLALAVFGAYAVSRGSSAQIVGPLARLRDAVTAVPAEAPAKGLLGAPAGYDEIDALQTAIQHLLARLDAALTQSRRFSADAAHELRTPLGTMRAELDLALEDPMDDGLRRALTRVRATTVSLAERTERLLVLAMPLEATAWARDAVSIADIVRESVASLDPLRAARVAVELDETALVRGDATLLRLVADNVIDNALKFAPEGNIQVTVTKHPNTVVLRVIDHGQGVPPDERTRVFEPFYRGARVRAGDVVGFGVGLALVAHVVRAHGGTAGFDDVATGAALRVTLPPWHGG